MLAAAISLLFFFFASKKKKRVVSLELANSSRVDRLANQAVVDTTRAAEQLYRRCARTYCAAARGGPTPSTMSAWHSNAPHLPDSANPPNAGPLALVLPLALTPLLAGARKNNAAVWIEAATDSPGGGLINCAQLLINPIFF